MPPRIIGNQRDSTTRSPWFKRHPLSPFTTGTVSRQKPLDRRPPFLLVEEDRELARVAPSVWSEKPIAVTILDEDFAARHPLPLLLALYRAQLIAASRQAGAAAGGVT